MPAASSRHIEPLLPGTIPGNPPVNTVAPVATGTATVGQVLSVTTGTWTGDPVITFSYQWQRGGSNIGGATSSSYTLVEADDGSNVRCVVTGTNASGSSSANSNALGPVVEAGVPTNSVAPVVSGTATVGQVLSSTAGTWTNFAGSVHTNAYQWQRAGANIGGATSSSYTLVNADDGLLIRCVVTATNDVGTSTGANSNALGPVVEPLATNSVVPALGGTNATTGAAITSTTGTWANMGGTIATFSYQWQDSANGTTGWANIPGATSASYTVAGGELAKYLRCAVAATNTGGTSSAVTTVASNQVAQGVVATGTPMANDPSATAYAKMIALGYSTSESARLRDAILATNHV